MLKPRVPTDLDHERDITLAIHAAIPDLITDTNRSNPHFHADEDGYASAAEPRLKVNAGSMNSVSRHALAAAASRP